MVEKLSDNVIPDSVKEVVSLGPNFNLKNSQTITHKKDILVSMKNIEHSISNLDFDNKIKDNLRSNIVDSIISCSKNKAHVPHNEKILTQKYLETKKFINDNPHLFFTRSDKGNVTVCLKTDDYVAKMLLLLNDKNTYTLINKNPLKKLQKDTSIILKDLNKKELLDKKYLNIQITLTDTILAKAYFPVFLNLNHILIIV